LLAFAKVSLLDAAAEVWAGWAYCTEFEDGY
jgi:hypothetical protein